jgi:hypothetical protein
MAATVAPAASAACTTAVPSEPNAPVIATRLPANDMETSCGCRADVSARQPVWVEAQAYRPAAGVAPAGGICHDAIRASPRLTG